METPQLIAVLVAFVVLFFGWQWWSRQSSVAKKSDVTQPSHPVPAVSSQPPTPVAPPTSVVPTASQPVAPAPSAPVVPGQSEMDLRLSEPNRNLAEDNLRHPENLFHGGTSGNLAAQNDGKLFGDTSSVFAFDGKEPSNLAEF